MRILHVIDIAAPVGGAQTYLHAVSALLTAAGHEVGILHGDCCVITRDGAQHATQDVVDAEAWVASFEPDVLHVHGAALPSHAELALQGLPRIHSLHDFSFACSSGTKYFRNGDVCTRAHGAGCLVAGVARGCMHRIDPRPFVVQYRRIERELQSLRRAPILVHSRFMRSVALANGLANASVTVVPLFVTRGEEPPSFPQNRRIAFAGRLVPEKGLDVLIEALAAIPASWERLSIAGDGWDGDRCMRLASRRGIGDRVEFLGHLDTQAVRDTFARACVVAVPSRWPEPFGIVGLEAMARARPVVASDVGGIPEWLDDGRTGVLVPPSDPPALSAALASLLADPNRAAALGAEGRRRVERFSPEVHVEQLLAVYQRAAGISRQTTPKARAS